MIEIFNLLRVELNAHDEITDLKTKLPELISLGINSQENFKTIMNKIINFIEKETVFKDFSFEETQNKNKFF